MLTLPSSDADIEGEDASVDNDDGVDKRAGAAADVGRIDVVQDVNDDGCVELLTTSMYDLSLARCTRIGILLPLAFMAPSIFSTEPITNGLAVEGEAAVRRCPSWPWGLTP